MILVAQDDASRNQAHGGREHERQLRVRSGNSSCGASPPAAENPKALGLTMQGLRP
jgi:hypothetical protein